MKTSKGWGNIHFWHTIPLNTQTQAYRGRGREMFSMHMERCGSKSQGQPLSASLHWRQPEALRLNYCLTPDLRSARTGWRWTTANESNVCFCNHRSCKCSAKDAAHSHHLLKIKSTLTNQQWSKHWEIFTLHTNALAQPMVWVWGQG